MISASFASRSSQLTAESLSDPDLEEPRLDFGLRNEPVRALVILLMEPRRDRTRADGWNGAVGLPAPEEEEVVVAVVEEEGETGAGAGTAAAGILLLPLPLSWERICWKNGASCS